LDVPQNPENFLIAEELSASEEREFSEFFGIDGKTSLIFRK